MRSLLSMLRPKPRADAGALYAAVVAEARRPAWYREGAVADTMDGRFAVLASLARAGHPPAGGRRRGAVRRSVALTESFIADMDAQMREEGFGDPSIGKQVRMMVGALASRVDRWRRARGGDESIGTTRSGSASIATIRRRRSGVTCSRPKRCGDFNGGLSGVRRPRADRRADRMSDFAHRLPLDQIRDGDRLDLVADDAECARHRRAAGPALARPAGGACRAGARRARRCAPPAGSRRRSTQGCVATGEPVPAHIDEPFELLFVPEPKGRRRRGGRAGRRTNSTPCSTTAPAIDLGGGDRRYAGAGARPLSAQPQCRRGAEGSGRAQRGGGRAVRGAGEAEGERGGMNICS